MSKTETKILVADDDYDIRQILEILFTGEGYTVITAKDGFEAIDMFNDSIDLVILDVNMPKKSGFIVASEIRKISFVPILFLTAYSQDSDKTIGYSTGADDYITKPFSHSELLLKVKSLIRRYNIYLPTSVKSNSKIDIQDLSIDLESQTIMIDKKIIQLTHTEYKILELLATHRKQIFSIDHIYNTIWDDNIVADSAVMVHIKNLRKKIESDTRNPKYIKTAWGRGYYID